jgi:hypothetical protein
MLGLLHYLFPRSATVLPELCRTRFFFYHQSEWHLDPNDADAKLAAETASGTDLAVK